MFVSGKPSKVISGSRLSSSVRRTAGVCLALFAAIAMGLFVPLERAEAQVLIAHWDFDDGSGQTATDVSGSGNDGTLGSTTGADPDDPNWICVAGGYALDFNQAAGDFLNVDNVNDNFDVSQGSYSAWLYRRFPDSSPDNHFFGNFYTNSQNHVQLRWRSSGGDWAFRYKANNVTDQRFVAASLIPQDTWTHVVATWDTGADEFKVYVGGSLQGTNTSLGTWVGSVATSRIGSRETNLETFDGRIDDVRIYDRALTQPEITTLAASPPVDCNPYAVTVTPDTTTASRLPSNGTNYTVDFTVTNTGSGSDDFDLLTTQIPGTAIAVVSITGTGVTQGANPDSARVANLAAADSAVVTVTYSVADVAAGTTDTLVFTARSVGDPATSDDGRLELTVIRPNMTTAKAVSPSGTQSPGTDLTYTLTITNEGSQDAASVVIVDSLAVEVQFKVGSVVNNLPTGITVTVEYSNDGGSIWTYTPVSAGCSAPTDYDACVTHVRWSLQNNLTSIPPNNTGDVQFVARIQ